MIDTIKDWAFSICVASICGTIMNILIPKGDMQKVFKTVYAVFLLCCILSPILKIGKIDFDSEMDIFENDYEYMNEEETFDSAAVQLENEIKLKTVSVLNENNIEYENISVNTNILNDGCIEITDFNISIFSQETAKVKDIIGKAVGIVPEIIVLGEN